MHQLLLDSQAPLLDARGFQVRIDDEHRRLNNDLRSVLEDLVHNRKQTFTDKLGGARGVARKVKPGIRVHWGIKDSSATTDHGFVAPEPRCPGESKSRRPVGLVRKHQVVAQTVVPYKGQVSRRGWVCIELHVRKALVWIAGARPDHHGRCTAEIHVDHRILQIVPIRRDFIAQA